MGLVGGPIVGGLVGLLGGPPGVAIGAVTGGFIGWIHDRIRQLWVVASVG